MATQERYFRDRRHVMRIDGNLVIAYNTDRPYPPQIDPVNTPKLRHMHLPIYDSRECPYLCAAPSSPEYSGAILGRLAQTMDHFPLVKTGSRYCLEPKLAARWRSLEQALMGVALCLLKNSPEPAVPLEYKFPPPPHLQGYLESYHSAHAARQAIQRSRDAFQPLIAHAAWAAILHRSRTFWIHYVPGADHGWTLDTSWIDALVRIGGVHTAWIKDLRMSAICNFSIRRAGLVLRDPKNWIYSSKLTALVLSNVPIWIIWGKGPQNTHPSTWTSVQVADFGPSVQEFTAAKDWLSDPKPTKAVPGPLWFNEPKQSLQRKGKEVRFGEVTYQDLESHTPEGRSSGTDNDNMGNMQLDVHEWIKLKQTLIEKAMANADPIKLRKWSQRQATANSHNCPGERGAIVYEWDKDEHQHPVRMRVNRANVEQAWCMFADTQRWYNCVNNEWELCHDLDPSAVPDDVDEEYAECLLEYEEQSNVCLEGWQNKDSMDANSADLTLNTNSFEPEDMAIQNRVDVGGHAMDAFELITFRYGFSYLNGTKYETYGKVPIKLQKALRIIGDGFETPVYSMEDGSEASFVQYVMYLDAVGHPDINVSEVPSALCDLYPSNPSFLGNRPSTVGVRPVVHRDMTLYIISHLSDDTDNGWVLAVKDPCTAVQCIRTRPTSLMELVRELIDARTAFYTLRPIPDCNSKEQGRVLQRREIFDGNRVGLGKRPLGHVLDLTDYVAYEAIKMKLLQEKRIARAVVKRGGIVSRLAAGLVDEYDVLDGPTWNEDGKCIRVSITMDGESREYFDDDISLEELATFVGLYSFKVPNAVPLSEQSWWPTYNKFEESGLNIGVWTPRCEQWFQSRRTDILEKGHKPMASSKWRTALRCEMETKRVYKAARTIAARYVADHCQ